MPAKNTAKKPAAKTPLKKPVAKKATRAPKPPAKKKPAKKKPTANRLSMQAKRDQQARRLELMNQKLELELSTSSGQALPAQQVQQEIEVANTIVRDRFGLMHKRLPRKLAGLSEAEMAAVIRQEVNTYLTGLCAKIEAAPP